MHICALAAITGVALGGLRRAPRRGSWVSVAAMALSVVLIPIHVAVDRESAARAARGEGATDIVSPAGIAREARESVYVEAGAAALAMAGILLARRRAKIL